MRDEGISSPSCSIQCRLCNGRWGAAERAGLAPGTNGCEERRQHEPQHRPGRRGERHRGHRAARLEPRPPIWLLDSVFCPNGGETFGRKSGAVWRPAPNGRGAGRESGRQFYGKGLDARLRSRNPDVGIGAGRGKKRGPPTSRNGRRARRPPHYGYRLADFRLDRGRA